MKVWPWKLYLLSTPNFLALSLFLCFLSAMKWKGSSAMPFYHSISSLEPSKHRLKPLKPWTKITLSFSKLFLLTYLITEMKKLTNKTMNFICHWVFETRSLQFVMGYILRSILYLNFCLMVLCWDVTVLFSWVLKFLLELFPMLWEDLCKKIFPQSQYMYFLSWLIQSGKEDKISSCFWWQKHTLCY